ncbi:MAG TPA: exodeoxyribonuclease VII small subunit [Candidatus Krumholzibacteria bacterium]|nr:exodeoxyribonuclease VII small subunit [Candidatus Krumholzibacteria bacterium]
MKKTKATDAATGTFEAAMKRLEKIVADLESGALPLAESLQKFEEGIALGKQCREMLDRADVQIRTLVETRPESPAIGDDLDKDEEDGDEFDED